MEEETKLRVFAVSVIFNIIFVFAIIGLLVSLSKIRASKYDEIRLRIETEEQYSVLKKKKNDLELANKHLLEELNEKEDKLDLLKKTIDNDFNIRVNKESLQEQTIDDHTDDLKVDNISPNKRD